MAHFKVEAKDRSYQFWERNSLGIDLVNETMFIQKLNYIHLNPLAPHWNLVNDPTEYNYSSAKYYERNERNFDFLKDLIAEF